MADTFSAGAVASKVSQILQGKAPETVKPVAEPAAAPATSKARADVSPDPLAELEAEIGGKPEIKDKGAETQKVPLSLESLATKLGVEVAELFELEIPMPDGAETLKLSALKDQVTERRRETSERMEWETTRDKERNQLANDRTELETLLKLIPAEHRTPALLRKAQDSIEYVRQEEAAKLVRRVPEWRDPNQFAADMEVISPHIAEFGFSKEELSQVYDHRLLAYIRHNALREKRIEVMLAEARGKREKKGSPTTNGRQPTNRRYEGGSSQKDRVSAVSQLLRDM